MEYVNNAAAQAAYVTSEEYFNDDPVHTMLSSNDVTLFTDYTVFVDDDTGSNAWGFGDSSVGAYIAVDLGDGNEKAYVKMRIYLGGNNDPNTFSIQYSDDGSDWDDAATGWTPILAGWNEVTWSTVGAHRYWRMLLTIDGGWSRAGRELELYTQSLQCYSEDTIKEQGNYSLKVFALDTESLNETLTKTVDPTIDLTGVTRIKLYIRSTRTGSNIKIGIHDSGGLISEITPNIIIANIFQLINWDISEIDDTDKDSIDQIIITIVNADSNTEFYLDCMDTGLIIFEKILTETLNLTDTVSKTCNWFRIFTESISLADTLSKVRTQFRTFTETLYLQDIYSRTVSFYRTLTESITLTDIYSRAWSIYRTFPESFSLTDTIIKKAAKTFNENLHLTDSYQRVVNWYRAFTEQITLIDTVIKIKRNLFLLLKKLRDLLDIEGH